MEGESYREIETERKVDALEFRVQPWGFRVCGWTCNAI